MPPEDRNLLIRAAFLLRFIRRGLDVLGYATVRRTLCAISRPEADTPSESAEEIDRVIWAVRTAGAKVLRENPCLAIAMATHWLLRWRGVPTDLRIGVARGGIVNLEAHAWVERNGRILIGEPPSLDR